MVTVTAAYHIIGTPALDGILIVGDHASNFVPDNINLGISDELLDQHIAYDIGVAEVATAMCDRDGFAAYLGAASRLVIDLNRERDSASIIPVTSDGFLIPGNDIDRNQTEDRLALYFDAYHSNLAEILVQFRPALILSLHSFTPILQSNPVQQRPWEVGVLYNEYAAASQLAITFLRQTGLVVGDQLPYSGKMLNATMNRHAEANDIPYVGIEMRQDMVTDEAGIDRFVQILDDMCNYIINHLANPE